MTAYYNVVYLDLATCKRTLLLSAWSMLDGVSMAVRSSHSSCLATSILWTDGRTDGSPDDRRRGERRVALHRHDRRHSCMIRRVESTIQHIRC